MTSTDRKTKFVLIPASIAAAVVVIILLSITSSVPTQNQQESVSNQQDQGNVTNIGNEQDTVESSPPTEDTGDLEEIDCEFVNAGLVSVFNLDTQNDPQRRFASELLIGEFCNRPQLVNEMLSFQEPSLGLVAYACDASRGMIGDTFLQESLVTYSQVYCESAEQVIILEADYALQGVESFREEVAIGSGEQDPSVENGETTNNSQPVIAALDRIIDDLNSAKRMANSDSAYEAMKLLEDAKNGFSSLLEEITGEA